MAPRPSSHSYDAPGILSRGAELRGRSAEGSRVSLKDLAFPARNEKQTQARTLSFSHLPSPPAPLYGVSSLPVLRFRLRTAGKVRKWRGRAKADDSFKNRLLSKPLPLPGPQFPHPQKEKGRPCQPSRASCFLFPSCPPSVGLSLAVRWGCFPVSGNCFSPSAYHRPLSQELFPPLWLFSLLPGLHGGGTQAMLLLLWGQPF